MSPKRRAQRLVVPFRRTSPFSTQRFRAPTLDICRDQSMPSPEAAYSAGPRSIWGFAAGGRDVIYAVAGVRACDTADRRDAGQACKSIGVRPQRRTVDHGFIDYVPTWQQGEGSGAATRGMLSHVNVTPELRTA